ncbi:hypothetical protein EIP91_001172 [Steccherinum ochraceum]|uniref:YEATS domain-containing protein n=1 Tax=Steccherinum ochraceum TaxID=92696 RepID=A0A4R0S2X1_9APHY|nr:hypothetical protein EIP91_001172 [Steccherinum ochraceum]
MSSYSGSDEDYVAAERPAKRQRLDPSPPSSRQILLEEIDLDIALRERLAQTIQSRITWALLLQEHTSKALHNPGLDSDDTIFRDTSLDALEAAEATSSVLFSRSVRRTTRAASITSTPVVDTPPINNLPPPPPEPIHRTRGAHRTVRAPPKKLLFLRNNASSPPQIVKLACPDCARTDFSSLQGLLNHCRLRHHREFGSHDECVQSAAVLIEGEEQKNWVVANGTEVAGISLPGLRRLFEIAVGTHGTTLSPAAPPAMPQAVLEPVTEDVDETPLPTPDEAQLLPSSSLLTRTLGLHEDSPALAPFLGRKAKQRQIHIYEAEDVIDLFSTQDQPSRAERWHTHYAGRSQAVDTLEPNKPEPEPPSPPSSPATSRQPHEVPSPQRSILHGAGSRFHILARVSVEDESFWIPPDKRLPSTPHHTHRWRLSVSSPSYSLPLISFLDKITVKCLSDPPPSTLSRPLIIEGPPFVITSTTDRPFLASLEFSWAAPDRNASMTVEHWVELDPLHLTTPVAGDQQVFDVELDRNTELLAARDEGATVSWETLFALPPVDEGTTSSGHHELLSNEAPTNLSVEGVHIQDQKRTPPDVKGRLNREMPYHMAATPMQFLNLVHGRRKAVEWARARVLHDAYNKSCVEDASKGNLSDGPTRATLSTADVYRWLDSEGHFPRNVNRKISPPPPQRRRTNNSNSNKDEMATFSSTRSATYCHRCGLHIQHHPGHQAVRASSGDVKQEEPSVSVGVSSGPTACSVFVTDPAPVPVLDVTQVLNKTWMRRADDVADAHSQYPWTADALLAVADPSLVVAIQDLLRSWKLTSPTSIGNGLGPNGRKSEPARSEMEAALAPAAILSLLVRLMAKRLLRRGVEGYRDDEKSNLVTPQPRRGAGKASGKEKDQTSMGMARRLLTPAHILRTVAQRGGGHEDDEHERAIAAIVIGRLGNRDEI